VQVYRENQESSEWIRWGNDILVSTGGDWTGQGVLSFNHDGTILAIGSRNANASKGQVQVLQLQEDADADADADADGIPQPQLWNLVGQIIVGAQDGEHSGASLQLSSDGSTLVIGSPFYDHEAGTQAEQIMIGRVTVWNYDGDANVWNQSAEIVGEAAGDEFGTDLALSAQADRLAIGAPSNDAVVVSSENVFTSKQENVGHVRVYEYNTSTLAWVQLGADINGEKYLDYSGGSIAMSSNGARIAIGAYMNDGMSEANPLDNRGHVRVYEYDDGGTLNRWEQVWFDIDGENPLDFSGGSIAMNENGSKLIVGAQNNDANGMEVRAGHARVFGFSATGWVQIAEDLDGEEGKDMFGYSVAMSGDGERVVVGAPAIARGDVNPDPGTVYVYQLMDVALSTSPPSSSPPRTSSGSSRGGRFFHRVIGIVVGCGCVIMSTSM